MSSDSITAMIATFGSIALAALTYWLTKQREHAAELRKEKLEHYKEFVASLSGISSGESTHDDQRFFSQACNKLNLVAPQSVLRALKLYQQEIKVSNSNRTQARHDELLSSLFYEIRRDLGVSPEDKSSTFEAGLWASGVPPRPKH